MIPSLITRLRNALRVARLRQNGCIVGKSVVVGRDVSAAAGVTIGDSTTIQDNVILSGSVRIGKGCRIEKLVEIRGNITVGDDTVIGGFSYLSTMPAGDLQIGNDVLVNAYSVIGATEHVGIGDHCIFAAYVHITDATHGIEKLEELIKHAIPSSAPISIGSNVWLGSAAMVMMGSTIGDGTVIGAKSLVNSDIPPMSIAFGVPARVIRDRRIPAKVQA